MESNYFSDKTILITGGLGFIGSNLAIRLVQSKPQKIIIVDSLVDGLGGSLNNISEIKNKEILEVYHGSDWDIKNTDKMKSLIKRSDIIFNLAGCVKHTKLGEKELDFDTKINFISQVFFLEACRQVMIENPNKKLKIIFAGTRDQYGKVLFDDLPVKESHLPKNLTDYQSISKNAAESYHMIVNNVLREQGIDIKINSIRLTNTYGLKQNSKSGAVVPVFIEKSLADGAIELWGGGESLRDFNHVDDVVDAFLLIVESELNREVFNLGCCVGKEGMEKSIGNNLVKIKKLAEMIVNIAGKGEIRIIPYPPERKVIEPGHFAADISKIFKLGWQPKTSLEEGLKKTIDWNKNNSNLVS
ncbi:NAD-dependent epimerase/dehydratase family protein [Candidatus Pacearchaeota archaeon]|nr:NAD-dependent epimerase/dehydratase family protein [Candidatus Pacearchaeota archaeon]